MIGLSPIPEPSSPPMAILESLHLENRNPLRYTATNPDSTEVGLFTRSGSVAEPLVKNIPPIPGKPSFPEAQSDVTSSVNDPPLKREEGAG